MASSPPPSIARPTRRVATLVGVALLAVSCASDGDDTALPSTTSTPPSAVDEAPATTTTAAPTTTSVPDHTFDERPAAVGQYTTTFVDETRETPSSGGLAGDAVRVIDTEIFHPVDDDRGPYPVVVFAHGFGGTPEGAINLIERWAAAGNIVVAPRFPLSRPDAPAGPDAGDVLGQTGDISFLITEVTALGAGTGTPLAGLVDPERIGLIGHSNGAITSVAVAGNTCCQDPRIDAVIEIAGTVQTFPGDGYDWGAAPPLLVVHGTGDTLVRYDEAIRIFNAAIGPKALLTIDGAQHGAYYSTSGIGHEATAVVTTDFLWTWLRDDADAAARLAAEPVFDDASVTAALDPGDTTTLELETTATDRVVGATPLTGLVDGTSVTVTWSGFIEDGTINIVQCSGGIDPGSDACDLARAILLRPNPGGDGTSVIEVHTGPIGSGMCGPGIDDCHLAVNDSGLSDPDATIYLPLEFIEPE